MLLEVKQKHINVGVRGDGCQCANEATGKQGIISGLFMCYRDSSTFGWSEDNIKRHIENKKEDDQ